MCLGSGLPAGANAPAYARQTAGVPKAGRPGSEGGCIQHGSGKGCPELMRQPCHHLPHGSQPLLGGQLSQQQLRPGVVMQEDDAPPIGNSRVSTCICRTTPKGSVSHQPWATSAGERCAQLIPSRPGQPFPTASRSQPDSDSGPRPSSAHSTTPAIVIQQKCGRFHGRPARMSGEPAPS